ncbi:MAG: phosphodiester glycosidase family protein [Clostridiales bacterium]|nr:phosphodiester glycosidase family protein [Clostridiales bacterium]
MSKTVRFLLIVVLALMFLSLPCVLSGGSMLYVSQEEDDDEWLEEDDDWLEEAFSFLYARAEDEAAAQTEGEAAAQVEEGMSVQAVGASLARVDTKLAELPIDLTPGKQPNPAAYGDRSYEDASIRVDVQSFQDDDKGFSGYIAYVEIASPTQLRTGVAGKNVESTRTGTVVAMAEKYNAVLAINGDYYTIAPKYTPFEYRMGIKVRNNIKTTRDILIIDENGDFHIVLSTKKADDQKKEIKEIREKHKIINGFSFGPALVKDGKEMKCNYTLYVPNSQQPRMAIGQLGECSYVVVLVEGRGDEEKGMTHQQLAHFMFELGCQQAYNLDGGNSAIMVLGKTVYKGDHSTDKLRAINDCIYFATSVDPKSWSD